MVEALRTVRVRLYTPADFIGRAICWRLESDYCHASIEFDDVVYTATFPQVLMLPPENDAVGQPPRGGRSFTLAVTDDQLSAARTWCRARVGRHYDWLSLLGWLFRLPRLQSRRDSYCFEFVRGALASAGLVGPSASLISGDELMCLVLQLGAVPEPETLPSRA
ncbi:hypothetical protein AA103196_2328 [Ameyamaea chiangmaiensis NBRC 103196]|nr:hypothetical protein AA103196_2328 [Ameyamaea chiangmaiensis NBRC 103196]